MEHRNKQSNGWLITHVNSLLDTTQAGEPLWETKCRGKGSEATLNSNPLTNKTEAEEYRDYLIKKGINCSVVPSSTTNESFVIVVTVADQQLKKTRFNTTHTDVSDDAALAKIIKMLNDATPPELGTWEVSANHSGQRLLTCVVHRERTAPQDDNKHLNTMINTLLNKGAFSPESRRSIKHYFLDNLYVDVHDNYTAYSIIDLAFMQQIEVIESMS